VPRLPIRRLHVGDLEGDVADAGFGSFAARIFDELRGGVDAERRASWSD
jgi:hypothetical protein